MEWNIKIDDRNSPNSWLGIPPINHTQKKCMWSIIHIYYNKKHTQNTSGFEQNPRQLPPNPGVSRKSSPSAASSTRARKSLQQSASGHPPRWIFQSLEFLRPPPPPKKKACKKRLARIAEASKNVQSLMVRTMDLWSTTPFGSASGFYFKGLKDTKHVNHEVK